MLERGRMSSKLQTKIIQRLGVEKWLGRSWAAAHRNGKLFCVAGVKVVESWQLLAWASGGGNEKGEGRQREGGRKRVWVRLFDRNPKNSGFFFYK